MIELFVALFVLYMSWIEYSAECDFPIENLPYGIFHLKTQPPSCARPGVAIGDWIIDLQVLTEQNVFPEVIKTSKCFFQVFFKLY
jgi:fumarylacetoacetase